MPDCSHADSVSTPAWHASLKLRFGRDGGTSRLTGREHSGPLRVQKALYPEGPAICHAIIIHPPGGVVGGDRLSIDVTAGEGAHALLTSPGAAKWYRSNGKISHQDVRIAAGPRAVVEWLPQETIFFNDAQVRIDHQVDLAADASYIGCDMLCFGRRAAGEVFASGAITQHTRIRRGGKLLWWEQGSIAGGSAAMASPLGLHGASVCATLVGVGPAAGTALIDTIRAIDPALGISQLKSVFVARYLGDDSEQARHLMLQVWLLLRPHLLGCAAQVPRIWRT